MLNNPRLKYCYHAELLDDKRVILTSENDNTVLSGNGVHLVLSQIQHKGVPLSELIANLQGQLSPTEVYSIIQQLDTQGYLAAEQPALSVEACAYWNSMGIDAEDLPRVLGEKRVALKILDPVPAEAFERAFASVGLRIASGEKYDLSVIVCDHYQRSELEQMNRRMIASGQPWLLIKPLEVETWIGPLFIPGETGCWACLRQRLELNRPIDTFYRIQGGGNTSLPRAFSMVQPSLEACANRTAVEIVKWFCLGRSETLTGTIVTVDGKSLESRRHQVEQRPQCPVCGDPSPVKPQPLILERRPSYCATPLGGYRELPPEETGERYQRHVSPITGVVQTSKPYHHVEGAPIYNYTSGHNIAFRSKTLFWLNQHIRSASGGKGKTRSQAKAGALCEAIERYSLAYHGDEYHISGSLERLNANSEHPAIHPNQCMNYSEAQFRNREALNKDSSQFYSLVPVPFDETAEVHWTPVWSQLEQRFKYLPSCFCYAQYPAGDEHRPFAYPDSNGCAAGNSKEEAILQGFLELVERDSVALWWYNRLPKPGVDLLSFKEQYFIQLLDYYKTLNRSLYVLDLTADLGIPAFGAFSHRIDGGRQNILFGFGAHVDARIGLERAVVELNQLLPIAHAAGTSREHGRYLTRDKSFVDWLNNATRESHPFVVPLESEPIKKAADYPSLCEPVIYDTIHYCVDSAARRGLETLVLDLTRRDVALPVVKVIVPGMRHFWPRLGPGRLYDVPVKMGWLDAPLTEEQLNPVGLFI